LKSIIGRFKNQDLFNLRLIISDIKNMERAISDKVILKIPGDIMKIEQLARSFYLPGVIKTYASKNNPQYIMDIAQAFGIGFITSSLQYWTVII